MDDTARPGGEGERTAGEQPGGARTRGGDTAEYSSSKAPETQPAATGDERSGDPRLLPGGAHRAAAEIGMSEMHREDVPNRAERTGLVHYGDTTDEGA